MNYHNFIPDRTGEFCADCGERRNFIEHNERLMRVNALLLEVSNHIPHSSTVNDLRRMANDPVLLDVFATALLGYKR